MARILDANLNRAREAARVMEDYARFVLDDPAGCALLKRLRHDLAAWERALPADVLLAARDTPADVGTAISTDSERLRAGPREVLSAAARRLQEALRTVEEYLKTLRPEMAAQVQAMRYRVYELEQRLSLRGTRAAAFARVRLYVLITAALCRGDWLETAEAAIRGGAGCLQLREKQMSDRVLLERARRLAALCREHGALCIINDRPDLAVLADADGVHLGQEDLPAPRARRIVGPDRLIGVSTHDAGQLEAALQAGPDYVAVGPVFASPTKPQDHVPGPPLLGAAVARSPVPVVAIGGIDAGNLGILVQAGARCVCVCSAVLGADDPHAAARRLAGGLPAPRPVEPDEPELAGA